MLKTDNIALPFLVWPLACVTGIAIAAGSLSYAPQGRINVLWVWLIWAGLPLLGSLISLFLALFGSSRPWLFQWRNRSFNWYPSRQQRLHMLWLLQAVWCVAAFGILLGYWVLLLFSDLAFGWSSTLVQDPALALRMAEWLAAPWHNIWPEASPTAGLVAATHYQRIDPAATEPALAGHWWRFLMASLIVYNLLPRALLALFFYLRWRWNRRPEVEVRTVSPRDQRSSQPNAALVEDKASNWGDATTIAWELDEPAAAAVLGLHAWADDEKRLNALLAQSPKRLFWRVKASRSPVAELSDLMNHARNSGVQQQALWAQADPETEPERHLASWRTFARQHQLVWITP